MGKNILKIFLFIIFLSINASPAPAFDVKIKQLRNAPKGAPVYLKNDKIFYAKGACGFLGFSKRTCKCRCQNVRFADKAS